MLQRMSAHQVMFFFCPATKKRAKSSVLGYTADNYCGEILGGDMVQFAMKAASQSQVLMYTPVSIHCDNRGILNHDNDMVNHWKRNNLKPMHSGRLNSLSHSTVFSPFINQSKEEMPSNVMIRIIVV